MFWMDMFPPRCICKSKDWSLENLPYHVYFTSLINEIQVESVTYISTLIPGKYYQHKFTSNLFRKQISIKVCIYRAVVDKSR